MENFNFCAVSNMPEKTVSSDLYFSVRLCIYTGKYKSEKTCVLLTYFMQSDSWPKKIGLWILPLCEKIPYSEFFHGLKISNCIHLDNADRIWMSIRVRNFSKHKTVKKRGKCKRICSWSEKMYISLDFTIYISLDFTIT